MRRTLAENNWHYDHSPVLGPGLFAGEAKSCCWGSHASKCDGMRLTIPCEPHGSRPHVAWNLPPRPPGKALGPQYETCRNPVKRKQPSISGTRPSKKFCKFMRGLPIACELRIPDCEFALSQESARNFGSRICSLSIQGIPMMLIALNKARCCFGSPSACSIIWKISRWIIIPSRKNWRGSLPCRFDHVGSMKQTRVPHHAIVEQFFLTCRRHPVPELVVTKVQLYRPGTNCWSQNFCAYLECDTLFRLDSKDEIIRSDGIRFI